jgi:ATP-dependent RNA helicase DeaD
MTSFEALGLIPELIKVVDELGFTNPTPIQEKIIPIILEEQKDLIGLAQTGTGKTAAFGLPIIQLTDDHLKAVQSLVLCPTRELCMQVANDLKTYCKYVPGIKVVPVYGGANIETQINALKKGCQIVVGTPGRTLDLIRRKVLKPQDIRWLVLDEADEMLNMGFKEELDAILQQTPGQKETLLFSATMPNEIRRIADTYMIHPEEILAGKKNIGAANLRHEFYVVQAKDRYEVLKRIADINPKIYSIVFCRTRRETKEVADKLIADGYNADALHGDLSQAQRDSVMNRFRIKHLQILVATDVAARGLDVNDLTHVINYNLPDEAETYIHRSGRTGRAGKSGVSVSICHSRELNKIRKLEELSGKKFTKRLVPDGKEICEKQLFNLIDKVENIEVDESQIEQFLPVIYEKLDWLSREDLIKHFVSVEFNRFLSYYKDSRDLNAASKPQKEPLKKGKARNFSRFFLSIGSKSGLTVPRLIGLINDSTGKRNIEIGKIDIMKKFSFFEVDSAYEAEVLNAFKNAKYEGGKVFVERSKPDGKSLRKKENSTFDSRKKKKTKTASKKQRRKRP